MATENSIEQSFKRWCDSQGYDTPKLKLNPGRGWPDRAVLLPGNKICWIEFKAPNGRLSEQQKFCIRRMAKSGHDVYVCKSVEEAKDAIARVSAGEQKLHVGSAVGR